MYDDGAETTRKQLVNSCLSLQIANDACLDSLIDVWRRVVRRVYHYYQLSAKAYFTYLNLNGKVRNYMYLDLNGKVRNYLKINGKVRNYLNLNG